MEKRVQRSLVKERIFVKGPSVCRGVSLAIHTGVASCMNVMGEPWESVVNSVWHCQ